MNVTVKQDSRFYIPVQLNNSYLRRSISYCLAILVLSVIATYSFASDTKDWLASNEENKNTINHQPWQNILDKYLSSNTPSGVNLFDYKHVSSADKVTLKKYLKALQAIKPSHFNKAVQKAYWINLYNALTVQLILENYPVKSITKLGEKFFAFGPWDDEIASVAGITLSLNDIEHKILRPIFKDARIHYAVNCASFSCPNLSNHAFTAANSEQLLNNGAHDYINHTRAVALEKNELKLSSIYEWYLIDFGNSTNSLLKHLIDYAEGDLKQKLIAFEVDSGDIEHHYDWQLNETK